MNLPTYQDLTKEQDAILTLPLTGKYLVSGPPGTGKSVLAIHRGARLNKQKKSMDIIMFNNMLSQYTQSATSELGINSNVKTFHKYVYSFCRNKLKTNAPEVKRYVFDWDRIHDIISNLDKNRLERLQKESTLLVDEGQDLPSNFYIILSLIYDSLTVFADENQRITDTNSTLDTIRASGHIKGDNHFRVTKNFRNTLQIALLANYFQVNKNDSDMRLPSREGAKPLYRSVSNFREEVNMIIRHSASYPEKTIGVLLPRNSLVENFKEELRSNSNNKVQYYTNYQKNKITFDQGGIIVLNYKSAKGLEFDTVFLPEIQSYNNDPASHEAKMELYVMISRARENLFIIENSGGYNIYDDYKDLFPDRNNNLIRYR